MTFALTKVNKLTYNSMWIQETISGEMVHSNVNVKHYECNCEVHIRFVYGQLMLSKVR